MWQSIREKGVMVGVSVTGTRKTVAVLYLPRLPLSTSITRRPAVTVWANVTWLYRCPSPRLLSGWCHSSPLSVIWVTHKKLCLTVCIWLTTLHVRLFSICKRGICQIRLVFQVFIYFLLVKHKWSCCADDRVTRSGTLCFLTTSGAIGGLFLRAGPRFVCRTENAGDVKQFHTIVKTDPLQTTSPSRIRREF